MKNLLTHGGKTDIAPDTLHKVRDESAAATPRLFHGTPIHLLRRGRRSGEIIADHALSCSRCQRAWSRGSFSVIQFTADQVILSGVCTHCEEELWRQQAAFVAVPVLRRFCSRVSAAILKRAASDGLIVSVSPLDLAQLFTGQKALCAWTGLPLSLNAGRGEQNRLKATVARLDMSGPYTLDNVAWVSWGAFLLRRDRPLAEFFDMCRLVTEHRRQAEDDLAAALTG